MDQVSDNFTFLKRWPLLVTLATQAEDYLYSDPHAALVKLRLFGEKLAERLFIEAGIPHAESYDQVSRLREIQRRNLIPRDTIDLLHTLRKAGNKAAHDLVGETEHAVRAIELTFVVAKRVAHIYFNVRAQDLKYKRPKRTEELESEQVKQLQARIAELEKAQQQEEAEQEQELKQPEPKAPSKKTLLEREERVLHTVHSIPETEHETRLLIDQQLRDAGWDVDTDALTHAAGIRPEKGRNLPIAEWPFQGKPADYVLFAGLQLVGIVEAKKARKDIPGAVQQAQRYAELIRPSDEYELVVDEHRKYKAPFLFAANGRPYLEQFKQKSGIWFQDTRSEDNHPRALISFHSPDGLKHLLKHDEATGNANLQKEPYDYLKDRNGLSLRDYQIEVLKKTEAAIQDGRRDALIVMATGTGKTRTAVGLAYRFLKTERFRRVLFLVDRVALGDQSADKFEDARIENLLTFTQIYDIKKLTDQTPEINTRVHFATVQGMVQRIFYADPEDRLPVDTYDCIIVDEAHRGYFLDKELGEEELFYKNQWDYQSKYRQVLAYFDSVKIALTATPAKHTVDIFGPPVATYSYREAVLDGFLVDHEPPVYIQTELSTEGITWDKGEVVKVYDPATQDISELANMEDELTFDVAQFNRKVVTENFNKVVVEYLSKVLDPDGQEKTLIFAATTAHADMLVDIFKQAFPGLADDAVMKITGAPDTDDPKGKIKRFKNERYPNIVATVDYLTTGIDVPEICNIVFLRRISSRILYEQMLGRATRLCDAIGKDHFTVYDAVGIYDKLQDYTQMKPVVVQPKSSVSGLIDEIAGIKTEDQRKVQVEAILGKIQRKRRSMSAKSREDFATKSQGSSVGDFVERVRAMPLDKQVEFIEQNRDLFEFFDRLLKDPDKQFISEHEDRLLSAGTGYPNGMRPADYIHSFKQHIESLQKSNEYTALRTILQRPSDLKRKDLKELLLHLEEKHYDYKTLKRAYEEMTNQEMAASIIGFIRQQALGTPILAHNMRIEQAVERLKAENDFNKNQAGWLDRIAEQLKRELVIDQDSFDREPFKQKGGFGQLNKIFNNRLPEIMERLHEEVYTADA